MTKTVTVKELLEKNMGELQIIDVRDSEEVILGKIENSINIPNCHTILRNLTKQKK